MATKIILKKSITSGAVPLSSHLEIAEIGINLADRKIYTKDNSGAIQRLDGAHISSTEPANASEGDLWYDTTTNVLKSHDGTSFTAAGYSTIAQLDDTNITGLGASNEFLVWNGTEWVNQTAAEGDIQLASELGASIDALLSVTDNGGDGSLTYSNNTLFYTGPSAAETRAHFTGGTGVTITDGEIEIGQDVATTADVTFGSVDTASIKDSGGTITLNPTDDLTNSGTVIVAGNLTVNGTTTSVNSNEVNIGDSIILLNADEISTPTQDGGIEIERGLLDNKLLKWNEADDAWDLLDETLQNVRIDGGSY